jgi:hypothetical protein
MLMPLDSPHRYSFPTLSEETFKSLSSTLDIQASWTEFANTAGVLAAARITSVHPRWRP